MRAPTVLALFAAVLFLCVPAQAAPDTTASPVPTDSTRSSPRAPSDTTIIPGPAAVAPSVTDTAPVKPKTSAASAQDSLRRPSYHSAGVSEGYRGHGMPPTIIPKPDSIVSAPVPAGPEIDTEIDEEKALEIKLKSDPEAARRYRSPRKAFFLSLMLPGAGQIYCGSWIKATFFAAAEVSLGVGWYQVAIVDARNKERQAEQYAALHWRQARYDSTWVRLYHSGQITSTQMQGAAPTRESLCDAIYGPAKGNATDSSRSGCLDNSSTQQNYSLYSQQFSVGGTSSAPGNWSQDSVAAFRSHNIKDLTAFYNVIGAQDLATGWEDNPDGMTVSEVQTYSDLRTSIDPSKAALATNPWGFSAMQNNYLAMRSRSDQLARMQKWFMGGMILNHLAAAFDAALQAGRMNRELLQLQTTWLDGIGVQGGLAWSAGTPGLQGRVDWSF